MAASSLEQPFVLQPQMTTLCQERTSVAAATLVDLSAQGDETLPLCIETGAQWKRGDP